LIEEKKDWQHGHSLESLKAIEAEYKQYNSYALSPFAQYKKNDIARDLGNDLAVCYGGKLVYARVAKKVKVAKARPAAISGRDLAAKRGSIRTRSMNSKTFSRELDLEDLRIN